MCPLSVVRCPLSVAVAASPRWIAEFSSLKTENVNLKTSPIPSDQDRFRRRRALPMTIRSERPMVAAQSTGLIRPQAASGTAAAL